MQLATPLLAQGLWQHEPISEPIAALMEHGDFRGQPGQTLLLYPRGAFASRRLLLIGLGERSMATADILRQAGARAARKAHELRLPGFAMSLPTIPNLPTMRAVQALIEGAELGVYRYLDQKSSLTSEQSHRIEQFTICLEEQHEAIQPAITRGQSIARGVARARDLTNAPANLLTPSRLGEVAQEIGSTTGIKVTVLDEQELQRQGFGGLLAVGRGSAQPPCFIIMEYGTPAPDRPTLCLVGKGITFDTGGISIKPAANMDAMKMDMGGSAAVLGTMQVIGELKPPLHIVGLISAAENMPGANAFRPGDVITTLSGKTVEVLNTDAEGRIVLADALFYAQRYQPRAIIDVATLTGAMNIALGPHAIGLMSNNQDLANRLLHAGEQSAERVWQFPLWDAYRDMIKSDIADIKNVAGRAGGAIVAAAFLDAFVGNYPWAHLDIAGTAWNEHPPRSYCAPGATGVGVRLFIQMIDDWLHA